MKMKSNSKNGLEKLPDDKLIVIISHLNLKEAARTSVLCQSLRYLWQYTYGMLDFVKPFILGLNRSPIVQISTRSCNIKMRFVEWVNLVLSQHKNGVIHQFRVAFNISEECSDAIDNWICYALERHVKTLVLDFGPWGLISYNGNYAVKGSLFSNNCTASLTALHLKGLNTKEEDLDLILSTITQLQVLRLEAIYFLRNPKISGPLPNLKRLAIRDCRSMRNLQVYAMNLLSSFSYRGPKISVTFKVYPTLIDAHLQGDIFFEDIERCQLWRHFSRLESLVLNFRIWPWYLGPPEFPKLGQLKKLELWLSGDIFHNYLTWCSKLLEASPSMRTFVLKIYNLTESPRTLEMGQQWTTSKHEHVKVMDLVGFCGLKEDIVLVHNLLDKFPSLEKLYVDPRPICYTRHWRKYLDFKQSFTAAQQLRHVLPPNAQLKVAFRHHDYFSNNTYYCY